MCVTRTRNGESWLWQNIREASRQRYAVRKRETARQRYAVRKREASRQRYTVRKHCRTDILVPIARSYNQKEQLFQPAAGDSINVRLPGCGVYPKNGACQVHKIHPVTSRAEKLFPFSVTLENC